MNPVLFFESVYEKPGATISATRQAAGYPVENITDWRTYPAARWKLDSTSEASAVYLTADLGASATPIECDTIGFAGHNLKSADAGYVVHYSDDGTNWTAAFSLRLAPTDAKFMDTFSGAGAHRWWRVRIRTSALNGFTVVPEIGILTLGRRLTFPEPLPPNADVHGVEYLVDWANSEGGYGLGGRLKSKRKRIALAWTQRMGGLPSSFFSGGSGLTFDDDFLPHAAVKPFWFAWNLDVSTTDVGLYRLHRRVTSPFVWTTARRALTMTIEETDAE